MSSEDRSQGSQQAGASGADAPTKESKENTPPSVWKRVLSDENKETATQFFSAYANTWIGLSPIWLMGEAIVPGAKFGAKFRKSRRNLVAAATDVRKAVASSSKDIVVIVDQKLSEGKEDAIKTAEVVKASGGNAIVVVTSSIETLQAHLENLEISPELKKTIKKNSRDVIVVLDKTLKHPIVVTGVTKLAKSQGIPHSEALLQLACLALNKLLKAIPEDPTENSDSGITELDATALASSATPADANKAQEVGHTAAGNPPPMKETPKDRSCCIA